MGNLSESIRKFKTARQTANKPIESEDEFEALIRLYKAIEPGKDALKHEFDKQWDKLTREKRSELVKRLIALGLLSSQVELALNVFKGRIVRLV